MNQSKGKDILHLFLTFLKIGAFTFGGGYAMIPLIEREVVEKNEYIDESELLDIFAIAESTPGVIAVNTATFVGYKTAGFWGSLFATLGVVLPSFVVIVLISMFLIQFKALKLVNYAFEGIRAGVVVLILGAVKKLSKNTEHNIFNFSMIAGAFILAFIFGVNAILLILAGLIIGFGSSLIPLFKTKRKDGENNDR